MDFLLSIDPQLQRITETLIERFTPRRVILFGSRARGEARAMSDYDIMVELEDGVDTRASRDAIYSAIGADGSSVDVIVRTAKRFSEMKDDPGYIDWDISREGRVLYENPESAPFRPGSARVSEPKGGWPSAAAWLRRAEEDYQHFEGTLRGDTPAWSAIGFHAHECAEKLLKALVVSQNAKPARTHVLAEILGGLSPSVRDDPRIVEACAVLQRYYPRTRYPDDEEDRPLSETEARDAATAARVVRGVVLPMLVSNT